MAPQASSGIAITASSSRARATTSATVVTSTPVRTAWRPARAGPHARTRSPSARPTAASTATAPAPLLSAVATYRAEPPPAVRAAARRRARGGTRPARRPPRSRDGHVEGELERPDAPQQPVQQQRGEQPGEHQLAGGAEDQSQHERHLGQEDHPGLALALQHQAVRLRRDEQRGQHRPGQRRGRRRRRHQLQRQAQRGHREDAEQQREQGDERRRSPCCTSLPHRPDPPPSGTRTGPRLRRRQRRART